MIRRLVSLILSVVFLGFAPLSQANVDIKKTLFTMEARIPFYGTVQNAQEKEAGYVSVYRTRASVFWIPATVVAVPVMGILSFIAYWGGFPSPEYFILSLKAVALSSAFASLFLGRLNEIKEVFTVKSDPGWFFNPRKIETPYRDKREVARQAHDLLFAPAVRLKKGKHKEDFRLKHFVLNGVHHVDKRQLDIHDIRVALEPADSNSSAHPITTSTFKVRPKTRLECLLDILSLSRFRAR